MVKLFWKPFSEFGFNSTPSDENHQRIRKCNCNCLRTVGDWILTVLLYLYDRIPWRHILPIMFLILYTVFGGWLFRHLEQEPDDFINSNHSFGIAKIDEISKNISTLKQRYRKEM